MKNAALSQSHKSLRLFMWLCVAALVLSALPLYAISFYNHPYYDDFGFSVKTHQAWRETGSIGSVLAAAVDSAKTVRNTWQGTYTGTLISNVQPGVFSEKLYFIGTFFILSAFLLCFGFFFSTVARRGFGLDGYETTIFTCLTLALMLQFMPDVGEAFFWFNGAIGNVFIYSLLALAAALGYRLMNVHGVLRTSMDTLALAVLMILLGGGSYGGGLFGLCFLGLATVWLFLKAHARKWHFLGLWVLFLICFIYSMAAPGNQVRAGVIGHQPSAIKAVLQAMYNGVAQLGSYIRLPLLAVSGMVAPFFYRAAKQSNHRFAHPWLAAALLVCLYCTQLAPPLYSGVGIGGGRIVDTYYLSFVSLWFLYLYYLLGRLARQAGELPPVDARMRSGLLIACVCVLLVGCLGFKRSEDRLYGAQNMASVSAALSIVTGEAARYDEEMTARETLLNDGSQPNITLSPLSAVPEVFMDDLISPNAVYDVRPSLCLYYGKNAIAIVGEEEAR